MTYFCSFDPWASFGDMKGGQSHAVFRSYLIESPHGFRTIDSVRVRGYWYLQDRDSKHLPLGHESLYTAKNLYLSNLSSPRQVTESLLAWRFLPYSSFAIICRSTGHIPIWNDYRIIQTREQLVMQCNLFPGPMVLLALFWLRESEIFNDVYLCSQQSLAASLEEIESLLAITLLHYWTHQTSLLFELQALKTKSSPCSQKFLVCSNNLIYSSFLFSTTRSTCTLLKWTYGAWEKVWTVCMSLLVTSERWRSNLFSTEGTSEHLTPQRCACYVVLKEILQRSDKNWEGSPTVGTTWPCQE